MGFIVDFVFYFFDDAGAFGDVGGGVGDGVGLEECLP